MFYIIWLITGFLAVGVGVLAVMPLDGEPGSPPSRG